jgi:hypothetical protein
MAYNFASLGIAFWINGSKLHNHMISTKISISMTLGKFIKKTQEEMARSKDDQVL